MKSSLVNQLNKLSSRGSQLVKRAGPILRAAGAVGQTLKGLGTKAVSGLMPGPMMGASAALSAPGIVSNYKNTKAGFKPPSLDT